MKLEAGEKIEHIIRKHPFYIIVETIIIIFLALSPQILISLFKLLINFVPMMADAGLSLSNQVPLGLQAFLYSLWLLTLWFILVYRFTDYYLDKWVVTNKRVIDVEQRGFFARETSSARYHKIQDITVTISGFLPTLFNFGTIQIQTAAEVLEFIFPDAPDPIRLKEYIMKIKVRETGDH